MIWNRLPGPLPNVVQVNGFWDSVPVIIAFGDGRTHDVVGAFFTYHGGDDVYPDDPAVPTFETDEGLPYSNVIAWAPMPAHPRHYDDA